VEVLTLALLSPLHEAGGQRPPASFLTMFPSLSYFLQKVGGGRE